MIRRDLVIVGAGPAGMAAALAAASVGMRPTVIDDQPAPGGQIYRQPPAGWKPVKRAGTASGVRGEQLLDRFRALGDRVELLSQSSVWGIFPPRQVAVLGPQGSQMIEADHLVLAPGAYEYLPPFPGWTLPGVMTPGAAQSLVKTMGVRPGNRAIVAGSGPFLLVVAAELHAAGVQVVAVLEAASRMRVLRAAGGLLWDLSTLAEGRQYLKRLKQLGIPLHWGNLVCEARGTGRLEQVVYAPCDRHWRADHRRAVEVGVDALCVGYGFVPRIELAQAAGCRLRYMEAQGGWAPETDENQRTSMSGVWSAGDGAGVAGAVVAELEGQLAGLAVACASGAMDETAFYELRRPIVNRLGRLRRFRAALDSAYAIQRGLCRLAGPETIVCRCEELTLGDVDEGIRHGGANVRSLKVMTRLGMGPCQGRMCWPAVARLISERTGISPGRIGPTRFRPPLSPVRLLDFSDEQTTADEAHV